MRKKVVLLWIVMLFLLSMKVWAQGTIKHLIFIVKENRSFDSLFNCFPGTGSCLSSFTCYGTEGGCTNGSMNVIQGNPTVAQQDCGHLHANFKVDYDDGAMDKFNQGCSGSTDWATTFNSTSLPHYWQWASTYGLGAIQASAMAPTFPSHMIIFAGTSSETRDNPDYLAAGVTPNGVSGAKWNLDAYHYGTCAVGSTKNQNGLCTFDSDCGGAAGSCWIDKPTGKCCRQGHACNFTTAGKSCTTDSDCASYQFCANGNVYGKNGPTASLYYAIDLAGSAGATGTNTGNNMYPGVCQNHRTTACVRVCGASSCTPSTAIDDAACTALADTCDDGLTTTAEILQGSRGSVGVNVTTVADLLDNAGVSWAYYAPSSENLRNPVSYYPHLWYGADRAKVFPDTQFATDVANCTSDATCTLASVIWLSASATNNEHPPSLMSDGEAWSNTQVTAVMSNSYLWNNSQIFIVWDDFGGFYDHVAPTLDQQSWRNGFRVPVISIGKYAKTGFISTSFVFESMLACVENMFLGGTRLPGSLFDASSNDLCTGCVAGAGCTGHTNNGMVDLTLSNPPL